MLIRSQLPVRLILHSTNHVKFEQRIYQYPKHHPHKTLALLLLCECWLSLLLCCCSYKRQVRPVTGVQKLWRWQRIHSAGASTIKQQQMCCCVCALPWHQSWAPLLVPIRDSINIARPSLPWQSTANGKASIFTNAGGQRCKVVWKTTHRTERRAQEQQLASFWVV